MKINLLLITFLSLFFELELEAQKKFEIGAGIDPLVIPLNIGNTQENGLGYYDIGLKSAITQSVAAEFTYWPFLHVGFSIGYRTIKYKSTIHCSIPDLPSFFNSDPGPYQNTLTYSSAGHGPMISLRARNQRFNFRVAAAVIDYHKHESEYVNHGIGSTTFSSGETIATLTFTENSVPGPFSHNLVQLEAEYNLIDNLYVKAAFEKSDSGYTLYSAQVTGFSEEMGPPERLLNEFEFKSSYTAFSLGLRYYLAFGGYPRKEEIRYGG